MLEEAAQRSEVVSSLTFPDSITSKHAAQSFGYLVRAYNLDNWQAASRILHILARHLIIEKEPEQDLSLTTKNCACIFSIEGCQLIDFLFSITSDPEYLTADTDILRTFQKSIDLLEETAGSLELEGREDAADNLRSTILKAKDFL